MPFGLNVMLLIIVLTVFLNIHIICFSFFRNTKQKAIFAFMGISLGGGTTVLTTILTSQLYSTEVSNYFESTKKMLSLLL